ncbi:MAG: hypothetical protein KBB83_03310 [Alphaproteobacteria bacterium]|nr:hypothetical protein [Alphaproteobacteria bacterium]
MNKKNLVIILFVQSAMLVMAGCQNYEPLERPDNGDPSYRKGPGLFTGDDGVYEINLD